MDNETRAPDGDRKQSLIVAGIVCAGLLGCALLWWNNRDAAEPGNGPDAGQPFFSAEAKPLAPRLYLLGRLAPSVAYVIETSDGLILVDTGLEADCRTLVEQMNDLGLDLNEVKIVLLTHIHGDHSLGAKRIRELTGAKVYAGRGDSELLRQGGPREAFFSTFSMPGITPHATTLDVELDGGEVIELGDTSVRVLATPGHTPGSVCYLLERDGQRYFFTGDTITSLIGELGTYAAYLAPRYRGNARDYLATLQQIRQLPKPDMVLPGHPTEGRVPHSPVVSESQWHELVDAGIHAMQELVGRYETDGEDFLDGQPKEMLPGLFYLGDVGGYAQYALRNQAGLFLFDAPGDDAVDELEMKLAERKLALSSLVAVLLTSADAESSRGLQLLIEKTNCAVVAAESAVDELRERCPPGTVLVTPDQLPPKSWLDVAAIPVDGMPGGAVTYQLSLDGKSALIAGFAPVNNMDVLKRVIGDLKQEENSRRYFESLSRLKAAEPNLWLPLQPTDGQNANLYDQQWQQMIDQSTRSMHEVLNSIRP